MEIEETVEPPLPVKTIVIMAHGNYDVNDRNYINTCILPDSKYIETVTIAAGFPGTVTRTDLATGVCSLFQNFGKKGKEQILSGFPAIPVPEAGVKSPLYEDPITKETDDGNDIIKLFKGKDVFILNAKFTDTSVAYPKFGASLQEYCTTRGSLPEGVYVDHGYITAVNISSYNPVRTETSVTRTLKLMLSGAASKEDPVLPWVGVWDVDAMKFNIPPSYSPLYFPNQPMTGLLPGYTSALASASAFGGINFGSVDECIQRILNHHEGYGESTFGIKCQLRIVVIACGVLLTTSTGDQKRLSDIAPRALFYPQCSASSSTSSSSSASSEWKTTSLTFDSSKTYDRVRLIAFDSVKTFYDVVDQSFNVRNSIELVKERYKGGKRSRRVKKTRKAPRSSRKGRSRRRRNAASTLRGRR